ncbi:hypothetical protein PZA11_006267 [Diplocarpon coronariae]
MADITKVKEVVKEALVGTEAEVQLSAQSKATFVKNARKDEATGELLMGEEEFVNAVAPPTEDFHKIKREQYAILFRVADRRNTGKINLFDWGTFENLLAKPDAEYEIAFRLFDVEQTGTVKYDDLKKLYHMNKGPDSIPFDWNCEWATLYSGGKKRRHDLTYPQFSQMLRGLPGERIRQAFHHFDGDGDGFIEPEQFQRIILQTARHKLSDHLLENLHTLCNISTGSKISYANVRAFQNIVREMDLVEMILRQATAQSRDGKITRTEFLNEAARLTRFSLFTPMEADILFHFASLDEPSGRLGLADFAKRLCGGRRRRRRPAATAGRNFLYGVLESAHHFALGSLAGAFGAFMVYPIDLVKTRMQNQRSSRVGQLLYKNSLDCARKVIKNEGFKGLYSGVLPQLVGVAPEKAIKLTVNDLVRGHFSGEDGSIRIPHEILAGGSAGACQVVHLHQPPRDRQDPAPGAGRGGQERRRRPRRSAMWIVRNLGLVGLYKGASACLLRDVPFSAIYFPTYNHLKRDYFGESPTKSLGILQLLTAGAIAGMPAAYLTTPCDVIKTRLQVEARKGESSYTSLRQCAQTVFREEGFKAFFKGGPARILRSSPQFGFTLAGYEVLQGLLPLPGSEKRDAPHMGVAGATHGLPGQEGPLSSLRSRNALKIILDLDEGFGRRTMPGTEAWKSLPKIVGGGGGASS